MIYVMLDEQGTGVLEGRFDDFNVAWYAAVSGMLSTAVSINCMKWFVVTQMLTIGTVTITMLVNMTLPHLPMLFDHFVVKRCLRRKALANGSIRVCAQVKVTGCGAHSFLRQITQASLNEIYIGESFDIAQVHRVFGVAYADT